MLQLEGVQQRMPLHFVFRFAISTDLHLFCSRRILLYGRISPTPPSAHKHNTLLQMGVNKGRWAILPSCVEDNEHVQHEASDSKQKKFPVITAVLLATVTSYSRAGAGVMSVKIQRNSPLCDRERDFFYVFNVLDLLQDLDTLTT